VLDQVARNSEDSTGFSKGRSNPLLDWVLSGHATGLSCCRSGDSRPWRSPPFLADLSGAAGYSLRVSGPKGAALQERIEAADCTVGRTRSCSSAAMARAAACGAPIRLWRLEVFSGRPPRFTLRRWMPNAGQHRWESPELEAHHRSCDRERPLPYSSLVMQASGER